MIDRDCGNCIHHEAGGCQVWECEFQPKNYKEYCCVDCKHLGASYDKHGWEYCYCTNEDGRGTTDEYREACEKLELTDEARKAYFEGLSDGC